MRHCHPAGKQQESTSRWAAGIDLSLVLVLLLVPSQPRGETTMHKDNSETDGLPNPKKKRKSSQRMAYQRLTLW